MVDESRHFLGEFRRSGFDEVLLYVIKRVRYPFAFSAGEHIRLPVSSDTNGREGKQLSEDSHGGAEGMEMRLVLVAICLLLVTPIAGSFWYVIIELISVVI